jgi:hypothetical protein
VAHGGIFQLAVLLLCSVELDPTYDPRVDDFLNPLLTHTVLNSSHMQHHVKARVHLKQAMLMAHEVLAICASDHAYFVAVELPAFRCRVEIAQAELGRGSEWWGTVVDVARLEPRVANVVLEDGCTELRVNESQQLGKIQARRQCVVDFAKPDDIGHSANELLK